MRSNTEESDTSPSIEIQIQNTLISIDNMSRKIKKELNIIKELVKENGHLCTVVSTTNETLSMQVQNMGMNVTEIINESKRNRLESILPDITSTNVAEYLDQINS
ncbi:PREDICTED: uncharacterized protein LOC108776142 [Cyphomyrmex costatus]|uniref:Uncharacterized protein n=1 Tax=Cyphomyrmex costatus TaxID=456900 RepID=A0A151IG04_9HYME|nr:PREDICTED: uncharacterized protein LOC108776142 [Cyphomyrmex costatus]XP_018398173.1 PREDICTED: uncharacterized protein LOC108776142 [Cyphomyrmex costatus]KYN00157.1 hypothetical protein ALC62_09036 [Cyphomyrmex costatus]